MLKDQILKVVVGSQAHGLATPESDIDYRGVFICPLTDIVDMKHKDNTGNIQWYEDSTGEGKQDQSIYELKHFLNLAVGSNPSILEVLVSPVKESTPEGDELRSLFPLLWSSLGVYSAFGGYSHNQLKKFIDEKDARPWKYMTARMRVLMLGIELLRYGTMTVNVQDQYKLLEQHIRNDNLDFPVTDMRTYLRAIKTGQASRGHAIDVSQHLSEQLKAAYDANPNKLSDFDAANAFLLKMRKSHW